MTHGRLVVLIALLSGLFVYSLHGQEAWQDRSERSRMQEWRQKIRKYPIRQTATSLERIGSFPSSGDEAKSQYLWNAERMTGGGEGEIIVADKKACRIFFFSSTGRIERIIGKRGQGPGEFQNPYSLSGSKVSLVVGDTKNMMLSFFTSPWQFTKAIKMFKAYYDIALSQDGTLYAVPLRTTKEAPLVDVLDKTGKLIGSFGQPRQDPGDDWLLPNFVIIDLNNDGDLLVAFQYHPTVCRYSNSGQLLNTYRIDHDIMRDDARFNLKRSKGDAIMQVIYAMRASRNSFFVLHSYPRIEIMEYNYKGILINDYFFETTYDSLFADLIVRNEGEAKLFYLLQTSPMNEIVVLRPKQSPE